jgi:serine protease SohB
MTDILMQYGLFLAKAVTVVVAITVIMVVVVSMSRKSRSAEGLEVTSLNEKYDAMAEVLQRGILPKKALKKALKEKKAQQKAQKKAKGGQPSSRKRVFVINFRGDIKASAVSALREEITAVLSLATQEDETLIRLENAGGLVHEHGLAASQLLRIKQRKIPLTIAVDKIAASGGYMMACVGDRIVAAPFAIVGSIGVLAQLPNFHRLLEQHGIDFEQIKAGELKRTITMFGKNTEVERDKVKEQLEDTHLLFKEFVTENRPRVDVDQIATGEHWHASRALALKLVDELTTSDDYLLSASKDADVFEVVYTTRKRLSERFMASLQHAIDRAILSCRQHFEQSHII